MITSNDPNDKPDEETSFFDDGIVMIMCICCGIIALFVLAMCLIF